MKIWKNKAIYSLLLRIIMSMFNNHECEENRKKNTLVYLISTLEFAIFASIHLKIMKNKIMFIYNSTCITLEISTVLFLA